MDLEIGAPSSGSRPPRGLGLPQRVGTGVLLVEYALLAVLAVTVGVFVARSFGAELAALFTVAAGTL